MKKERIIETCKCNRRDLLRWGGHAGAAWTFSQVLGITTLFGESSAPARACILLWMTGGPSQLDTFDPKPGKSIDGEFRAIPTAVPGIQISEHLPLLAREMKDLAVIRSMTSKEGNHDRARYYVHTGYAPAGVTQHPSFGSIVAKEMLEKSQNLPSYVSVNGPGMPAGLLGVKFAPFVVRDPQKPPENLAYADTVTPARFESRIKLLDVLNASFSETHSHQELEKKQTIYERAIELMNSPALAAFDVSKEKHSVRQSYGNTRIGAGCLLARRLIQNGVKFVEVEMDGWDTHFDNFKRTRELLEQLDPAYSSLIRDLRDTGLLESTLVIWMGEFGRTPEINKNGGRDHWPQAWTAVVAGGGIQGGQVIGSTDTRGYDVKDRPVTLPDFYATLCRCFGIDDSKYNSSPQGRPLRITDKGQPITEII